MNNMSEHTKQALTGTLKEFIQQSEGMNAQELHKLACSMFTESFGDRPQLAKVAAQTYNSTKTIHEIGVRPLDKKAADIDLLDPDAVCTHVARSVAEPLQKAASGITYSFTLEKGSAPELMQKAASEKSGKPDFSEAPLSCRSLQAARLDYDSMLNNGTKKLLKLAADRDYSRYAAARLSEGLVAMLREHDEYIQKRAADNMISCFGEDLRPLLNECSKQTGLSKLASAERKTFQVCEFPALGEVCEAWLGAVDRYNYLNDLHKVASDIYIKASYASPLSTMWKEAATSIADAGQDIRNLAIQAIIGADDKSQADVMKDMVRPDVEKSLRGLGMQEALVDVASDPYISTFGLDKVRHAYNDTLARVPDKVKASPGANVGLLRDMVAERLSRGNVPSAADIDRTFTAERAFSGTPNTGIYKYEEEK